MKKIVFFVQWMLCGGVENSLISLTNQLVSDGNDVTIYVIKKSGGFIEKVSKKVKLKEIPMPEEIRKSISVGGDKITIRTCLKEKQYFRAAKFLVKHLVKGKQFSELNINLDKIPKLDEEYDIAVNYHLHSPFLVWYLSEKVHAKKKWAWIHNDFETTHYDIRKLKRYLECIDRFFGVANKLVEEFNVLLPEYQKKIQVALNIVPTEEIMIKSEEFYPEEFRDVHVIKILTVGRLEEQKGYDLLLKVAEKLKGRGCTFKWFILGEGTQREKLEDEIKKIGIGEYVRLLGVRMNPYPYFKNCDIYVQTSRHEGYVTTVTEAKLFNLPIVCTDISGAREQLVDGITGDIVRVSEDDIFEKVEKLINDKNKRKQYSDALAKEIKGKDSEWISLFK